MSWDARTIVMNGIEELDLNEEEQSGDRVSSWKQVKSWENQ